MQRLLLSVIAALLIVVLLGGGYYIYSLNRERGVFRNEVAALRAELEAEKERTPEVVERVIEKTITQQSSGPTTADRIYVKELCEGKYSEVEKDLFELAQSPNFEKMKTFYENQCGQGSTFDRLDSPYFCDGLQAYVNTRESYVPYCEKYYLSR